MYNTAQLQYMGAKKSKPSPIAPSTATSSTPALPPTTTTTSSSTPKRKNLNTKLADATRYNLADVRSLHEEFCSIAKRTQPVNRITKAQFRDILSDHRVPWRSDVFVNRLFDFFDKREDGSINFGEFVRGLALASSGDPRDKLKLSFDVFDVEGTGTIARWEMKQVLEGIFVTAEQFQHGAAAGETIRTQKASQIETFVNNVFASYDKDKTGQLSFMEYMQAAMKYPNLTDFMSTSMFKMDEHSQSVTKSEETTTLTTMTPAEKRLQALETRNQNQKQKLEDISHKIGSVSMTSHIRPHHNDHTINISRKQILKLKATFDRLSKETKESPNEIEKQQLKDVFDTMGIDWKNDDYLNRLFDVVDTHGSNTINYQECLIGLSMLMNGNPQERLALSFELFDVDGTGTITKNEMMTVLRASSSNDNETDTLQFVNDVFQTVDKQQNGCLTLREFTNACLKGNMQGKLFL